MRQKYNFMAGNTYLWLTSEFTFYFCVHPAGVDMDGSGLLGSLLEFVSLEAVSSEERETLGTVSLKSIVVGK